MPGVELCLYLYLLLPRFGITLYLFQLEAVKCLSTGSDVFVVQNTSSGKSMIFWMLAALYPYWTHFIFVPTTAIATDQMMKLEENGIRAEFIKSERDLTRFSIPPRPRVRTIFLPVHVKHPKLIGLMQVNHCIWCSKHLGRSRRNVACCKGCGKPGHKDCDKTTEELCPRCAVLSGLPNICTEHTIFLIYLLMMNFQFSCSQK